MEVFIRQIVDRCHVADSFEDVCRYVISRLNGGMSRFLSWPRWARRELLTISCKVHKENRQLFMDISNLT